MRTYKEALDWIHSRLQFGIKPGLERMEWMLNELGNPHKKIACVHIAGTNGKGSTVTYMRTILQEAGYTIGTFTSPYIETFNERISVNGTPISDEDITYLVQMVKPAVDKLEQTNLGAATEFEIITVMAFYYFGFVQACDVVLLETGLGGRYDSTNVVHPLLSVITTIGHDHMHILGETLAAIAGEKAGIIKHSVPVITGVSQPEAVEVILAEASSQKAPVYQLHTDFTSRYIASSEEGEVFSFTSEKDSWERLIISMKGEHQVHNASLALRGVLYLRDHHRFNITNQHIEKGLRQAFWLGRFEIVASKPDVILDGAHNPEGVNGLVKTLETHYGDRRITVLFTALGDKQVEGMIAALEGIANQMIFTTFDFPRAASPELLAVYSKQPIIYHNWKEAIEEAYGRLTQEDVFVITGSLYFIAEVRKYWRSR
jgi:dihydrofolate synthase/folylpolyglutamate synthase